MPTTIPTRGAPSRLLAALRRGPLAAAFAAALAANTPAALAQEVTL